MVEISREPGVSGVTLATIGAVLAIMLIVLGMAGITIGGSALEHSIDMAACARGLNVRTGQFERGRIVIECRREPGIG